MIGAWKRTGLTIVVAAGLGTAPALAQECTPTPEMNAVRIVSETGAPLVSVAGDQSFYQQLDNGWVFGLVNHQFGWVIRLYDDAAVGDATDLTSLTPPHGGVPNARDVFGWHFRNQANTGPNQGDVNAPQQIRAFVISPGLAGTGGYKPSTDPTELRLSDPGPDEGIGWLRIEDMGLGQLNPGEQATMNYLQFAACVSWPKLAEQQMAEADAASLEFNALDAGLFSACGLDVDIYELNAQWLPRRKTIDMDGDGTGDVVAQVARTSDRALGLALCRNASEMHVFGFDTGDAGPGLQSDYVGQTEAWHWITGLDEVPPSLGSIDLPEAEGGVLVLERIEKEAVAVFWREGQLTSEHLYHFVEP